MWHGHVCAKIRIYVAILRIGIVVLIPIILNLISVKILSTVVIILYSVVLI